MLLADILLTPGGILSWIIVGLIAGWLTGLVMRGGGYGIFRDIVLGLIGAFIGGLVFSLFTDKVYGFWGSIGVAFVGACVLVAIVRMVAPRPRF
jgi:uncharacterized membrane protein YeaQ/YmgE (transglycosylase-associated protein family)